LFIRVYGGTTVPDTKIVAPFYSSTKSALAAKYVFDKQVPCYFNILAEGRNRPALFLKSIRQQLISRYQLQDANDDDLATLLTKVSKKLPAGDRS
jgi:hypothetical protein